MGCFSYICKECDKPILSNSFRGEKVILYLLIGGNIIEQMEGEYDSYGTVFNEDLKSSKEWISSSWEDIVDMHTGTNKATGIAAIHCRCFRDLVPIKRSKDDPNQGWGENSELLADVDEEREFNWVKHNIDERRSNNTDE